MSSDKQNYDEEISSSDQRFYDAYSGLEICDTEEDVDDLDIAFEDEEDLL
jgi:hypothetical protein